MHISRVIDENVHKMAKRGFMAQKIYHLVEHKNLNIAVYVSRDIDENV